MAGWNAIAGFSYQHLCASLVAIDLVGDPEFDHLLLEAMEDATDFEAYSSAGERLLVGQVKNQDDDKAFQPSQVRRYLLDWNTLDARSAEFRLVTNAHASPSLRTDVLEPLMELRERDQSDLEESALPFELPASFLSRVEIVCSYGKKEHVFEHLVHRIQTLREHRCPTTLHDARSCADALYREVSFTSGQREPRERRLSRTRIAQVIGLTVGDIERTTTWSPTLYLTYSERLHARLPLFSLRGGLAGSMASCVSPKFDDGRGKEKQLVDILNGLSSERFVVLSGAPGSGKSVAMDLVLQQLLGSGELCIPLDVTSYVKRSWRPRLGTFVCDTLDADLNPQWLEVAVQHHGSVTILVDGVSEVDEETWKAVKDDLTNLSRSFRTIRLCVSGRDDGRLGQLSGVSYRLRQTDTAMALKIVERTAGHVGVMATQVLRDLESLLGPVWHNPLLLRLGIEYLRTADEGRVSASDAEGWAVRREPIPLQSLYQDWICELGRQAPDNVDPDVSTLVFGRIAEEFAKQNIVSVSRLRIVHMIAEAIEELAQQGVVGAQTKPSPQSLLKCGLLHSPAASSMVSFLHDSLRDFFVAQNVSATRIIPELSPNVWEEAAKFFSPEQVWPQLLKTVASLSAVAAWRLSSAAPRIQDGVECDMRTKEAASYLAALSAGMPDIGYRLAAFQNKGGGLCVLRLVGEQSKTGFVSQEAAAALNGTEVAGVWFKAPPSSLRVALELWVVELRSHLSQFTKDHETVPARKAELRALDNAALVDALAIYGRQCLDVFERLLEALPPNIRETVRSGVGWTGFSADVEPAFLQTSLFGKKELRHPVLYRFQGSRVALVQEPQGLRPGWTSEDAVSLLAMTPAERLWESVTRSLVRAFRGLYR